MPLATDSENDAFSLTCARPPLRSPVREAPDPGAPPDRRYARRRATRDATRDRRPTHPSMSHAPLKDSNDRSHSPSWIWDFEVRISNPRRGWRYGHRDPGARGAPIRRDRTGRLATPVGTLASARTSHGRHRVSYVSTGRLTRNYLDLDRCSVLHTARVSIGPNDSGAVFMYSFV